MVEDNERARSDAVAFLTTEHFTLSGARSSAVAETNARLQLYMGALSGTIVALALVAQISRLGPVFFSFALVLLPVNYFLGLATMFRLMQSWIEWFRAMQGMNRIRRYFVEQAPEIAHYLVMPTSDDPLTTLRGAGIAIRSQSWWSGLVTATAVVSIINSVIVGIIGVLAGDLAGEGGAALPVVFGVVGFLANFGLTTFLSDRWFQRQTAGAEVRFPPGRSTEEPVDDE